MLHNAFVGEKLPVHLEITNRSWLPFPWLMVEERVPLDLKDSLEYRNVLAVGSRAVVDHTYTLYCKRRGYYAVGPMSLSTGDLFGFADAQWIEDQPAYVTVYPQVVPLHQLGLPSRSPFGVLPSRQRLFEDPNRMTGVREYMSGDSQRRIHWKASAHEDTLLVKKFQPAIALNVSIVLDLNSLNYPISSAIGSSEWGIIVAASLASYVAGQRQPVGLDHERSRRTHGRDDHAHPLPARAGPSHDDSHGARPCADSRSGCDAVRMVTSPDRRHGVGHYPDRGHSASQRGRCLGAAQRIPPRLQRSSPWCAPRNPISMQCAHRRRS